MRLFRTMTTAALCLLFAACGSSTPSTTTGTTVADITQALSATVTTLSTGSITAAQRTYCAGIASIPFSPGQTVTHAHAGGFLYATAGVATTQVGAAVATSGPGQANFIPEQVTHTETNFGSVPFSIDFFRLGAAGKCTVPPAFAGAAVIFAGPDQPSTLPSYTETLSQVTLGNGGRTARHTGSMQMYLVLSGSIVFLTNATLTTVGPNQGYFIASTDTSQEYDASGGSSFLAFVVQ